MSGNYEIQTGTLPPQHTAIVMGRLPRYSATVNDFTGESFMLAWDYLQAVGATVTGPSFLRFVSSNAITLQVEAGFPVAAPIAGGAQVKASELPGGQVAVTWHLGPHDGLPDARAALENWVVSNGHQIAGGLWEVYVSDPGTEADPAKWQTQLVQPFV